MRDGRQRIVKWNTGSFMIRNFRNDSGYPTDKFVIREQTYVLLHVFVQYAIKTYQLKRILLAALGVLNNRRNHERLPPSQGRRK